MIVKRMRRRSDIGHTIAVCLHSKAGYSQLLVEPCVCRDVTVGVPQNSCIYINIYVYIYVYIICIHEYKYKCFFI